jgi:hypothetical protein
MLVNYDLNSASCRRDDRGDTNGCIYNSDAAIAAAAAAAAVDDDNDDKQDALNALEQQTRLTIRLSQ